MIALAPFVHSHNVSVCVSICVFVCVRVRVRMRAHVHVRLVCACVYVCVSDCLCACALSINIIVRLQRNIVLDVFVLKPHADFAWKRRANNMVQQFDTVRSAVRFHLGQST
jgi:hypothetical protein